MWLFAAAIFLVALALRLIFLLYSRDRFWPHSTYFEGDAPLFAHWAAALDRGERFEEGLPLHSPAVAYLMHWFAAPGGPRDWPLPARDFLALKCAWCGLSAATSAVFFVLAARTVGLRAAWAAVMLLMFSFGSYVTAASLNSETPYAFVVVALVALTTWFADLKRRGAIASLVCLAVALGVLHGLGCLLRAEHPLLVVLLACGMIASPARGLPQPAIVADPRRGRGWLSVGTTVLMIATMVGVCLPWTLAARAAIDRMNRETTLPPDYEHAAIAWTDDARRLVDAMPAFARADNVRYVSDTLARAGRKQVSGGEVEAFLRRQFDYIPAPLSRRVFVSSQGPLAFALANHPKADGGFSKAALDARFEPDPSLQMTLPSHLRLYNDGYAAGWRSIGSDPAAWLGLVGRKLTRFAAGATLGVGATNWPVGRSGTRAAVDLATPLPGGVWCVWQTLWGVALASGVYVAAKRRVGGLWLLVIAYKLAVTVAFFGYARQAVSIAPAFCLLAALAVDRLVRFLPARLAGPRIGYGCVLMVLAVMLATDLAIARRPAEMRIRGPARPATHWAPNAFESNQSIDILLEAPAKTK
ncbi:MAG: hypothetical protein HZB38_03915 [Planctomycetes bacterium]|nr:hypothetical protein [Planctomycetota bacterium]